MWPIAFVQSCVLRGNTHALAAKNVLSAVGMQWRLLIHLLGRRLAEITIALLWLVLYATLSRNP
jgi:hypothetical protein